LETLAADGNAAGPAGFKRLIWQAVRHAARGEASPGIVADGGSGQDALFAAAGTGTWIARPIDAGAANLAVTLREWPLEHVVKCTLELPPQGADLAPERLAALGTLQEACRATHHELLLSLHAPPGQVADAASVMAAVYGAGVLPDWWGAAATLLDDETWRGASNVIVANDPHCRGMLLWLNAEAAGLDADVRTARAHSICQGFVAGRTVFGDVAEAWFGGAMDDAAAVAAMAERYDRIVQLWCRAAA
jgi:5-dehydro-2-deoxygluconokinase